MIFSPKGQTVWRTASTFSSITYRNRRYVMIVIETKKKVQITNRLLSVSKMDKEPHLHAIRQVVKSQKNVRTFKCRKTH